MKPDPWLYLDEITHRTLNDYTAMLAILRRASYRTKDVIGLAALDAVARRLHAAAMAYKALSPSRSSATRNLEEDLEQLCASLATSILADRSIHVTLSSDPVSLSARRSWQISLIVSELVTNAAKHAQASLVNVDLNTDDGVLQLTIRDDGVGGADHNHGAGLVGLSDRIEALGGRLQVTSPAGGESWPIGSQRTITWTAGSGNVRIELSRDGGLNFDDVLFSNIVNDGQETWTVSGAATTQARVRVTMLGGDLSATSPAAFAITAAAGEFQVTTPAGGESWSIGWAMPVAGCCVPATISRRTSCGRVTASSKATLAPRPQPRRSTRRRRR